MADYIEREALIDNLKRFAPEHFSELIQMLVEKQPAADVAPVVHGEWMWNDDEQGFYCQHCPTTYWKSPDVPSAFKYCPHCGAVMDGGKK